MAKPALSTADQLERLVSDFDRLVADARGVRGPVDIHEIEERGQILAHSILKACRGPAARPAECPPIRVTARGAWW